MMRAARHYGIPPQPIQGRTELIEDVARDVAAWPHGRLWRARAEIETPVEAAGITRLPLGVWGLIWVGLSALLWTGIVATIWWALS